MNLKDNFSNEITMDKRMIEADKARLDGIAIGFPEDEFIVRLNRDYNNMNDLLEERVKERTKELQNKNDELEKINTDLVQLIHSRSNLLANVAHELGESVTLIHGYAQFVQEGLIEANEGEYLEMVLHKVSVLDRLINDLSNFSRLKSGHMNVKLERIRLDQWIKQVVHKLRFEVGKNGRRFKSPLISTVPMLDEYFIMIDTDRMDQVFSNLIRNAIKHTEPNTGEITFDIRIEESDQKVIIDIHDNGDGIDKESLPFIFERYHKEVASPNRGKAEGSGLGLAIVKEIITHHKARIWAVSEVNMGSSFSIALPTQHV